MPARPAGAAHRRRRPAAAALQERFARKNEDQLLRAAFERLDSNHDGQITVDELQAYFEAMGHKVKKVQCEGAAYGAEAQVQATAPAQSPRIPFPSRPKWRI